MAPRSPRRRPQRRHSRKEITGSSCREDRSLGAGPVVGTTDQVRPQDGERSHKAQRARVRLAGRSSSDPIRWRPSRRPRTPILCRTRCGMWPPCNGQRRSETCDFDCTGLQVVGPRPPPGMTLETRAVGQRQGPLVLFRARCATRPRSRGKHVSAKSWSCPVRVHQCHGRARYASLSVMVVLGTTIHDFLRMPSCEVPVGARTCPAHQATTFRSSSASISACE